MGFQMVASLEMWKAERKVDQTGRLMVAMRDSMLAASWVCWKAG